MSDLYSLSFKNPKQEEIPMESFKGKVLLIVNTASQCGLTPQYVGLESIYKELGADDFSVIGFPSNQFMGQEPLKNDEIEEACLLNYGVTFPLSEKVDVNGSKAHPVFKYLKNKKGGFLSSAIKWNFTKFLVDKSGNVVQRYAPTVKPESIKKDIKALIAK